MPLQIPERYNEALARLRTLNEGVVERVVSVISEVADLRSPGLADRLSKEGIFTDEEARQFAELVKALYLIRASADVAIDKFVEDVCQAMNRTDIPALHLGQDYEAFKRRLGYLLNVEEVSVKSKALTLQTDHDHVFCGARIFTDVRHAFKSDASEEPMGAVIFHMLKVSSHENGQHKDFYVALDDDDLATLQDILNRAQDKAVTLRRLFQRWNIKDLS